MTTLGDTCGHGADSSIAVLSWPPSNDGRPSISSAEQLLFLINGQMKVFLMLQNGQRFAGTLKPGGFLRVPALAVSLLSNDAESPASLLQCCSPSLHEPRGSGCVELAAPWEEEIDCRVAWRFEVDPARYALAEQETDPLTWKEGLGRSSGRVAEYAIDRGFAVSLRTRMLYGTQGSLMVASRPPDYHSTPHLHDCEQLNVVSEGQLWGFMISPAGEGVAFLLSPGSLWRVPPLTVHWAWNRGETPATLLEYHSPGLQGDPVVGAGAVSLLLADENLGYHPPRVSNLFLPVEQSVIREVEELPSHPSMPVDGRLEVGKD